MALMAVDGRVAAGRHRLLPTLIARVTGAFRAKYVHQLEGAMRAVMKAVFAGLLLLAAAETAIADPFEDGVAALDRRDYMAALQLLRPLAESGNPDAQINLANMYFDGNGVPQNYAEGVKLYLAAAEKGSADARIALGFLYEYGDAVPRDYVQAYKWFDLAGASMYRDTVAAKMTQAQIQEAQRLTKEWTPK